MNVHVAAQRKGAGGAKGIQVARRTVKDVRHQFGGKGLGYHLRAGEQRPIIEAIVGVALNHERHMPQRFGGAPVKGFLLRPEQYA